MPTTPVDPAQRDIRWIKLPGTDEPVPAWQDSAGNWLAASIPRLIPVGCRTHQLIEAAAPRAVPLVLAEAEPIPTAAADTSWPRVASAERASQLAGEHLANS